MSDRRDTRDTSDTRDADAQTLWPTHDPHANRPTPLQMNRLYNECLERAENARQLAIKMTNGDYGPNHRLVEQNWKVNSDALLDAGACRRVERILRTESGEQVTPMTQETTIKYLKIEWRTRYWHAEDNDRWCDWSRWMSGQSFHTSPVAIALTVGDVALVTFDYVHPRTKKQYLQTEYRLQKNG